MIKPIGSAVVVRIYSGGSLAAVAVSLNRRDEFPAVLRGAAGGESIRCLMETNGIFGLEMFALVATVVGLNEQLRGERIALFFG